ncbi:pentapeptide repeat-containing protein [Streptomyces cinnamoneus]|uniref:pentapeptide repeat-containing protein n=1 Tax=Streptomyces cinnamoneus TaxID=53446 RepID=UPI0033E4B9C3
MTESTKAAMPQLWLKGLGAAAAVIICLSGIVVLLWRAPWVLDRLELRQLEGSAKATVVAGFRTALALVLASTVPAAGLVLGARRFEHTRDKDRRDHELAREAQVADRFVQAMELLGAATLAQRLGGVHALEGIMHDSKKHHDTVVQVLTGFIRERAPRDLESAAGTQAPGDVRAALTVLGRRPQCDDEMEIDLSHVDVSGADLHHARLDRVLFVGSRFDGVVLIGAVLAGSSFYQASLRGVVAHSADLRGAQLSEADLREGDFGGADLTDALLKEADLRGTFLRGAHLGELGTARIDESTVFDEAVARGVAVEVEAVE